MTIRLGVLKNVLFDNMNDDRQFISVPTTIRLARKCCGSDCYFAVLNNVERKILILNKSKTLYRSEKHSDYFVGADCGIWPHCYRKKPN